jgi:uncharacterized membrane protein YdbT with pleckstrin-like domain
MEMPVVYKSKIGWEILIPMSLILGVVTVMMIQIGAWLGLVICGLVIAFIAHLWTGTSYTITSGRQLIIKCGILEKYEISIDQIKAIKKSKELTNAPALSVHRLEITYSGGRILISPRQKEKFVNDLRVINPKIWWSGESY